MSTAPSFVRIVRNADRESLTERILSDRAALRAELVDSGAILFRGFDVGGVEGFDTAVRSIADSGPLDYVERSSPRKSIQGNIYTSTEYPAREEIFLHNENSYQAVWPRLLFFHCVQPPDAGGATPLADTRRIHETIAPEIRDEFVRRKWLVVRNYSEDLGLPWQEVFNTTSRQQVERQCARHGIDVEWLGPARLRTRAVREAVHHHPVTGVPVWFNHATVFHVTTLPAVVRRGLLEMCGRENLPSNTYFGDGAEIPADVLDHLRSAYLASSTRFDYERDDVLLIDNMLTAHGREPFTGRRRVAVAMAEPSDRM
ncbi:TauD/TfdA family dioxygenase [Streptomyces goshikiensis]|uniref:TauD/TfdA family dioxygenase n=1 Tax=Streptomyces goshikiensis TaxID=1942 RepID=UPI0036B336FC